MQNPAYSYEFIHLYNSVNKAEERTFIFQEQIYNNKGEKLLSDKVSSKYKNKQFLYKTIMICLVNH